MESSTIKRIIFISAILAAPYFLSGCPARLAQKANDQINASQTENIKVYNSKAELPANYHVRGHISTSSTTMIGMNLSQETIDVNLKVAAQKLGGNAVLVTHRGAETTKGLALYIPPQAQ